ncbi:hypothetical protein TCAP_04467 [Tolypocladium capitatum]|uniref:Uncharacterized protein n=1 Tax=Tolypocladium capitatum TaxID=45235 RepID=A0A2K3QDJ8_9HYPO|nr:hypothetical protein TCAP_04467 [Tolypocladium capitatum]
MPEYRFLASAEDDICQTSVLGEAGHATVGIFPRFPRVLNLKKVLPCFPRPSPRLTEFRSVGLPDINDAQSCLGAHGLNVLQAMLVRVKPVELLALGDDTSQLSKLDIAPGSEEEPMACSRLLLELCLKIPILFAEPRLAGEPVGVVETVDEELPVQAVLGMVGCPYLIFVLGEQVAVHSDEQQVIRSHDLGPRPEMGQGFEERVIAEHRPQREEQAWGLDTLHIILTVLKSPPETGAFDVAVRGRLTDVGLERLLGNVQGQVLGWHSCGFKGSKQAFDFARVASWTTQFVSMGSISTESESLWGQHLPGSQVNHGDSWLDTGNDVSSVSVKQGHLFACLVKLVGEDDFIPNGQTNVVVQQLVGEGWHFAMLVDGHESVPQVIANLVVHGTPANIDDLTVAGRFRSKDHGAAQERRRGMPRVC